MAACPIVETVNGSTFTFWFEDQFVDVDAATDVMLVSDLWTAIKLAQWRAAGWAHGQIATGGGLDSLGEVDGDDIESYLTVTLLDGWEIRSLKEGGKFTVTGGNLIKDNGMDPFVDNPLITHFLFLSQAGTVARVAVGSAVTPDDITAIGAEVEGRILSDGTAFAGANIDAAISSAGGLTVEQAAQLASAATNADVATSTRASLTAQTTQTTWLTRLATVLGAPGAPASVLSSSGTVGAGGTLTTLRRVAGALWGTIVTTDAGEVTETTTVTPEADP